MDDLVTDPAKDVSTDDPALRWTGLAARSHVKMHELYEQARQESQWRKECIRMAVAMGASQVEIAKALGISREQVSSLVYDRKQ